MLFRSSFIVFNDTDFSDIDYLFVKSKKKKKKKKKKFKNKSNTNSGNKTSEKNKKTENNEEENEEIRKRLLRALRSNSMKELVNNYSQEKTNENKITKYLVKTESNGKYIQSQLIVVPEDLNVINNTNNTLNNSINDNNISKENINNNSYNNQYNSQNSGEKEISNFNTKNSEEEKKDKEKIFHDIIQQSNLGNSAKNINSTNNSNEIANTITIKNENLVNILEKNQISIRWCKICNMILPSDQEPNAHIKSNEHQKLVKEYNLSMQEELNTIMLFKSIPGNINEELKSERMNAIKLREKKLKQKMALKAVKHENYRTYKQDFPSPNKQRLQKLSFEIEKQIFPIIKDYDTIESLLKELFIL